MRSSATAAAVELDDEVISEVDGRPVKVGFGGHLLTPGSYGGTTLELYRDRVVEKTKHIVSRREAELLLTDVESVELLTAGNSSYLGLGILTLLLLIGIVFLVLYFLFPHRILLIRGKSTALLVAVKGDVDPYLDFMEATLLQAKRAPTAVLRSGKESLQENRLRDDHQLPDSRHCRHLYAGLDLLQRTSSSKTLALGAA